LLTLKKSPALEDNVFASRVGPAATLLEVPAGDAVADPAAAGLAVDPTNSGPASDVASALPPGAPSVSQ
jgi:hypothetical protein